MNVLEPSADKVHYPPAPLQDAVTLCGITDWLGHEHKGDGARTGKPVTCKLCKSIMDFCHGRM